MHETLKLFNTLVFDFDGLILETEMPDFQSWQEVFHNYGCTLSLSTWLPLVGSGSSSHRFNIYDYFEEQLGHPIDREEVRRQRRKRYAELAAAQPLMPGVSSTIEAARHLGIGLAVASSSKREWVVEHLRRLQILNTFSCIICGDDVQHTKPYPDIYLEVLRRLQVPAQQAVALEDSPNGVQAAKRADIFCIAIPGPMTRQCNFDLADLQLASLTELQLDPVVRATSHYGIIRRSGS